MNIASRSTPTAPTSTSTATIASGPMHAAVRTRYGAPDVLTYVEVAPPVPGAGQVRVRVHAAGVSIGDHHVVTGKPVVIRVTPFGGLPRPKHRVPGSAFAGRVEAVGAGVTSLKIGDAVFGEVMHGAFAELVVVDADKLVAKPSEVSFEDAAAMPWAVTALQALRDAAGLKAGEHVLINGASGALGSWAVQIAKALGAEVTAVCGARAVERMRALGADHVIDYAKDDFAAGGTRYDVMLDLVANRSVSTCKRVLTPTGRYVASAGGKSSLGFIGRAALVALTSMLSRRTLRSFLVKPTPADLRAVSDLVTSGKARPSIERRFALSEVAAALTHVGSGHSQGQTIVTTGA